MDRIIRKLTENDYEQWKTLWYGYLGSYVAELSENVTNTTFTRLISDAEPMHCLVTEEHGTLTGLVHFVLHRSTWATENYCYLEDLFVAVDARKNGTGRALIEAVNAAAKDLNCSRVYWVTRENNYRARSLYDQLAVKSDFIQYRLVI